MVKPLEQNMGAEALRAATGRDHEGWRDLLTGAGAMEWTHAQTAKWLVDEHQISGWWAQGITVDFEQARKGRLPGQKCDGSFSSATTRTIKGSRLEALEAVVGVIAADHGEPHGQNLAASIPIVRWRLADGTRLHAAAQPAKPTGTPITITWEKLPDHDSIAAAKQRSIDLLAKAELR